MTGFNYSMMGRDETQPGALFYRLVNPTDFDTVVEAMRVRIKNEFTWDLINPTLWGLVGFNGGPIKQWLTRYIIVADKFKMPYTPVQWEKWKTEFMREYGYDEESLKVYFKTFSQLADGGKVPSTVYRPFEYEPTSDPGIIEGVKDLVKGAAEEGQKVATKGVVMLGVAGVSYLLIREFIFGKKLSRR